jgi:hypothetical protein
MENKDEKLIRSRNFTPSEINILVQLVEKRRQILECKKTGVITKKKKNATWEELAKEFNSLSGCLPRSAKVLRDKWANIKKTALRNHSADNSYLYSKAAKSYFDEPREKLSSRPLCGRDKTISRSSKDFVAEVYTTFCVQPENL